MTVSFRFVLSFDSRWIRLISLDSLDSFRQIAKLMLIPATCGLEYVLLGVRYSPPIVVSIVIVLVGVGIACAMISQ